MHRHAHRSIEPPKGGRACRAGPVLDRSSLESSWRLTLQWVKIDTASDERAQRNPVVRSMHSPTDLGNLGLGPHTATFMHHHHSVRSDLDTKPLLCWWPEIVACSRRCNPENTTLSLAVATDTVSGGPPGTSELVHSGCPLRDPVRGPKEVVRLPCGPPTNQWSIGAASLVRCVGGKPAPSAVGGRPLVKTWTCVI